jgi:hypothetical protein
MLWDAGMEVGFALVHASDGGCGEGSEKDELVSLERLQPRHLLEQPQLVA